MRIYIHIHHFYVYCPDTTCDGKSKFGIAGHSTLDWWETWETRVKKTCVIYVYTYKQKTYI